MTKTFLLALAVSIGISQAQTLVPRVSMGRQMYSLGVSEGPEKPAVRTGSATGGVLRGGMLLRPITPLYPPNAIETGVTGIVTVEVVVGKDGRVIATRVVDGPYALRRSAENAVRRFLYEPTLLNGKPVEREALVEMRYRL